MSQEGKGPKRNNILIMFVLCIDSRTYIPFYLAQCTSEILSESVCEGTNMWPDSNVDLEAVFSNLVA